MSGVDYEVVSLAERPELWEAAFEIGTGENDYEFMHKAEKSRLYSDAFHARWAEYALVLLDGDKVIARALSIPFFAEDDASRFPEDGVEGVIWRAALDVLNGQPPNTLAALEINIHDDYRSKAVSYDALEALRGLAKRLGFEHLVCPVRPTKKQDQPLMPMQDYIDMTRDDGLPFDPWLRVHVRAGGTIIGVCPFSMFIYGTLDEWAEWGHRFDTDGPVVVEGGLVPVTVSLQDRTAVYVEPNVWVQHHTDPAAARTA